MCHHVLQYILQPEVKKSDFTSLKLIFWEHNWTYWLISYEHNVSAFTVSTLIYLKENNRYRESKSVDYRYINKKKERLITAEGEWL